jgi:GntR family transcriptional regulator
MAGHPNEEPDSAAVRMSKFTQLFDRSRAPLYVQVAAVMRERIDSGQWVEGEKISTIEELEREFSVARVTIRQGIELLRKDGLLEARQGRGTFVSGRSKKPRWLNLVTDFDSLIDSLRNNVLKRIQIVENLAPPTLARDEGKSARSYVFLRSVQYNGGEPFSVVNLHLDRRIYDRDARRFTGTAALPEIVEMSDIKIAHANQTLTIGVADMETAELLKLGLGEPTANCRLVLIDDQGVAIYVADIRYIKDCFAMRSDLLAHRRTKRGSPRRGKVRP